jgi:hypothetical protein
VSIDFTTNHSAPAGWITARRRSLIAQAALYLGAVAVLATGVDHIEQYYVDKYSTVPTIGTLFFLNFVSSVVVAIGLVAPLRRVAGRHADAIRAFFAVSGIGIGILSLAALFVSEGPGLFGFVEHGYREAITLAIVAEAAAAVFLVIYLVSSGLTSRRAWVSRRRAFRPTGNAA